MKNTPNRNHCRWLFPGCRVGALLAMAWVVFIASGCTQTVRTANMNSADLAAMEALNNEQNRDTQLEGLPPTELVNRGNIYLARGSSRLAKIHFAMAVRKDSTFVPALIGLGEVLLQEQGLEQARQVFARALVLDPGNRAALTDIAKTCRLLNDLDPAVEYGHQALALSPDNPGIITELANTYDAMGRETEAQRLYLEVVSLTPQQSSAHNNLGLSYLQQGKYQEATRAFSDALRLKPDDRMVQSSLAAAYALAGDQDRALALMTAAVGKPGAYNNLGYIYMTQGKCAAAKDAFTRAMDLNPQFYVRAHENLERLQAVCGEMKNKEVTLDLVPAAESGQSAPLPAAGKISEPSAFSRSVVVIVDLLNMRAEPGTDHAVVGEARRGEVFRVVEEQGEWLRVLSKSGLTGWVSKAFVQEPS